jgi:hypothetical protein
MLGVTNGRLADDAEDPIIPENLRFGPSQQIFGDFEVCPFTAKAGPHADGLYSERYESFHQVR